MSDYPPDHAPRTVRPRKPQYDHFPIIALSRDEVLVEALDGATFAASELPDILQAAPSSLIVVQGFGKHLQRLEQKFQSDPQFNYRCTPIHRYSRPWDDGRRLQQGMIVDAVCNFVGWSNPDKRRKNRYHYPIDPIWFLTTSIDDINDSDEPRLTKLFKWAVEVRQWCEDNNVRVKASAGGLAAQLLRDPRFYPEPRRKAPRLINDIARFQLPGNYYQLFADRDRPYRALHLDMESAHHSLAATIEFPCVNDLHAYGFWSTDEREQPHARSFAPADSDILQYPGLFHVSLSVPHIPRQFYPPPYMQRPGVHQCFVYSNELELIRSLGGRVLKVHSAYVSRRVDKGLNAYAGFALDQIRKYPDYKPWLKPTLHAAYGLLAARPKPFETGYLRAKGGEPAEYLMGPISVYVKAKKQNHEVESSIANVIHRGMIEAAVRREALWFARFLTEVDGHDILAIYADALFVRDSGRPLRLLPPPWRLSGTLKHLRFHSATTFTSDRLNRLPGVPQTAREAFLRQRELGRELRRDGPSERAHARRRKPDSVRATR